MTELFMPYTFYYHITVNLKYSSRHFDFLPSPSPPLHTADLDDLFQDYYFGQDDAGGFQPGESTNNVQ